ncbi:hypothetical protein TRICHSKD4_3023 [Roseibium sp. TrichSKD4]|uniref:hypothetical protein n=1 Tax=Roseibium sp. TrichSKD4 TaxID=744980 RepID=UPI0001E56A8C|nr:hypothetical protein [Roseibium sp. TrichSKD4]EFO31928.1 hypothetical protein TRICHSKD4_3023 [Roseibium sp. TrichSKD4]
MPETDLQAVADGLLANLSKGMMLPAEKLSQLKQVDTLVAQAKAAKSEAEKLRTVAQTEYEILIEHEFEWQKQVLVRNIQKLYFSEQLRAQEKLKASLSEFKVEITETVLNILEKLIGEIDDQERVALLTEKALRSKDRIDGSRVVCAPDVVESVSKAASEIEKEDSIKVKVEADTSLDPGRALLITAGGYVEIGANEILKNVLGDKRLESLLGNSDEQN